MKNNSLLQSFLILLAIACACNPAHKESVTGESNTITKEGTGIYSPDNGNTNKQSASIYCWCFLAKHSKKNNKGEIVEDLRLCTTPARISPKDLINSTHLSASTQDKSTIDNLAKMLSSNYQEKAAPSANEDCRLLLHLIGKGNKIDTFIYVNASIVRIGNKYRMYSFNMKDSLLFYFKKEKFDCPNN